MNIPSIQSNLPPMGVNSSQSVQKNQQANQSSGVSFDQMLDSLNNTQTQSDTLIQQLAAGENVDIHQVMIASEQTDISFRVAMAIRDRLVDAYREVMRMNV
jgi:flagellar hook-basal body complex protein FliE